MKQNETIVRLLEQASAQLGPCGNEACKFFINLAIEHVQQWSTPKYSEVITDLYRFFDDETTYSKLIEQMNSAQTEVSRLSNALLRRKEESDPEDIAATDDCSDFFTTLNCMLWILKPIGRNAERAYEDRVREIEEQKAKEKKDEK